MGDRQSRVQVEPIDVNRLKGAIGVGKKNKPEKYTPQQTVTRKNQSMSDDDDDDETTTPEDEFSSDTEGYTSPVHFMVPEYTSSGELQRSLSDCEHDPVADDFTDEENASTEPKNGDASVSVSFGDVQLLSVPYRTASPRSKSPVDSESDGMVTLDGDRYHPNHGSSSEFSSEDSEQSSSGDNGHVADSEPDTDGSVYDEDIHTSVKVSHRGCRETNETESGALLNSAQGGTAETISVNVSRYLLPRHGLWTSARRGNDATKEHRIKNPTSKNVLAKRCVRGGPSSAGGHGKRLLRDKLTAGKLKLCLPRKHSVIWEENDVSSENDSHTEELLSSESGSTIEGETTYLSEGITVTENTDIHFEDCDTKERNTNDLLQTTTASRCDRSFVEKDSANVTVVAEVIKPMSPVMPEGRRSDSSIKNGPHEGENICSEHSNHHDEDRCIYHGASAENMLTDVSEDINNFCHFDNHTSDPNYTKFKRENRSGFSVSSKTKIQDAQSAINKDNLVHCTEASTETTTTEDNPQKSWQVTHIFENNKSERHTNSLSNISAGMLQRETVTLRCQLKSPPYSQDEEHVCETCGQFFNLREHLDAHRIVHPAKHIRDRLRCGGCGVTFWTLGDLHGHLDAIRSQQGTRCYRCRQWFGTCDDLYRHRQHRHYGQAGAGTLLALTGFLVQKRPKYLRRL